LNLVFEGVGGGGALRRSAVPVPEAQPPSSRRSRDVYVGYGAGDCLSLEQYRI